MYFDCITVFKVLYLSTSINSGAPTRYVNTTTIVNPALNRSSEIQRFECYNMIEIRAGMISAWEPHIGFLLMSKYDRLAVNCVIRNF